MNAVDDKREAHLGFVSWLFLRKIRHETAQMFKIIVARSSCLGFVAP